MPEISHKPMQDDVDPELLSLFLEEAGELYPQIQSALRDWQGEPGAPLLARRLQRLLHTFKGSARMAGAMRIGELIHQMEGSVVQAAPPCDAPFWEGLHGALLRIDALIGELQRGQTGDHSAAPPEDEEEAQASLGDISKRLYRIVRQTGKTLGKKVNLEIIGDKLELNRDMLDKMTAPLEHLLRNAIAHGLEKPSERQEAGKSPVGEIRLALRREQKELLFEFSDDGIGLNIDKLRRKAVELGVIKAHEALSDKEAMQLIFVPGLSTAPAVTEIAGRGVGMDVVRSEIKSMGGRITALSKRGEGTCFIIRVPEKTDIQ